MNVGDTFERNVPEKHFLVSQAVKCREKLSEANRHIAILHRKINEGNYEI
jgi:hypothetical protein